MKIRDIAFALPSTQVSSQTIAEWTGADPTFILEKVGVANRAFLAADEAPLTLATQACESLFARNPTLAREDVRLLILVTQTPDFRLPHSSALLQHNLKLPVGTAAFDVSLGCSGWTYALTVAKGFMATEGIKEAILVTCDPYSRVMDQADKETVSVFGDAATATWLSSEVGAELGRLEFGTDGGGGMNLVIKSGGGSAPISSVWSGETAPAASADFRVKMNGRAVFNFVMDRVPKSVDRCLELNGLQKADVDLFAFHQASKFLLDNLARRMALPAEKVPSNLREIGNTVSSSIPLLLSQLKDEGRLAGKRVVVSGFGVGLSWATNVLHFPAN